MLTPPKLKVAEVIVRPIAVHVMNSFVPFQRPAQSSRHHETVLIHLAVLVCLTPERVISSKGHPNVAIVTKRPTPLPPTMGCPEPSALHLHASVGDGGPDPGVGNTKLLLDVSERVAVPVELNGNAFIEGTGLSAHLGSSHQRTHQPSSL